MQQVADFVRDYNALIILGLVAVDLVLLLIAVSLSVKLRGFTRQRNAKLDSGQVGEIVDHITDHAHTLDAIKNTLTEVSGRQDDLDVGADLVRAARGHGAFRCVR